jgi:PAS domain S-box-containing protein
MGSTRIESLIPFKGRRRTDRTHRSLIATAAIVALVALIACWFSTREVANGIVNFEGRESARDWAISFSHSLSHGNSALPASPLRPYSKATSPERFKALDNAMFEGEILSYRLYSADGVIVASSAFEEIGKTVNDPVLPQVLDHGDSRAYVMRDEIRDLTSGSEWTATALAPLSRGADTIGIFEVTVDVSERAKQLNRLRYMAFGALVALLASIFGILGFSISRTLHKQREAQQALALSERQHRQLLDDAPDSMVIHNLKEVLYVNAAAVALHDAASRDELIGRDPMELVPEDKRGAVAEHRRMALSRGELQTTELVGRRRLDGEIVETDSMGIPIDWDGQSCILIQSRDVTSQRAAQRDIAEREAQVRAFMENNRSGMFIKDLSSRIVLVNRSYEDFHGIDRSEILGKSPDSYLSTESAEKFKRRDREIIAGRKAIAYETILNDASGAERVIREDLFPISKPNGEILGVGGIFADITEIKEREDQILKAQAEAEKAQAQLAAFFDHSPSGMYLKDRDLNVTMVNRAFEKFYDVASDDIVGRPISDWRPGSLSADVDALDMAVADKGESMDMETEIENADGDFRIIVLNKFPIFAANGEVVGVGGVNTGVTDARSQEAEMRQTQARLAAYIDHIPMMVILLDRDSRFLMVNHRYEAFFDVAMADLVGQIGNDHLTPERREMFLVENRQTCDRQETTNQVIEMQNAAGETRLLQQTKFPIVTGDELPVAVGVVLQDITDQKKHERDLETARDDAESANRAKSAFLANMSHEIRTPMNGVFGMADLLAQSALSTEQQRYLNTIRRSGEALLGVINNVLDVSRVEAGEFELDINTFNLHDVIAEAIELFTESASAKGVFIAHNIAGNVPPWTSGDSVRLRQVLTNLVGNAIKFTQQGSIVLRAIRIGGDADNALIRFEVSDTAIGIERGKLVTLFEPFQQADTSITRKYGGSGLGLSIAGHIVGLMGGRIDVDSEPGKGSSFIFSVPMAIDTSKTSPRSAEKKILSGKRLLIVDDNAVNLEILTDFARDWDTEFIAVSNAEDAQAAIRDAAHAETPFDIALIDIVMPGMDGIALAEWISAYDKLGRTKLIGLTSFN